MSHEDDPVPALDPDGNDFSLPRYGSRLAVTALDPGPRLSSPWEALKSLLSRRREVDGLVQILRSRTGAKHVVCFSSGGAALTVGLLSADLPRGGEVVVPSYICRRVADAVISAGLKICLVDVGPNWLVSTRAVEETVSEETCAIIAPQLYGDICDMAGLREIAEERGLFLVDDAAQAMGAKAGSSPAGTMGDFGIFSFGPTKIGSGMGGGCLLTDRDDLYQNIPDQLPAPTSWEEFSENTRFLFEKRFRRSTTPYRFWKKRNSPRTYADYLVPKQESIKLEQIGKTQSRSGLASLLDLDKELSARKMLAERLEEELADLEGVELPVDNDNRVWGAYPVLSLKRHRFDVCSDLSRRYVETIPPYIPIHLQKPYLKESRIGSGMNWSEKAFRQLVVLPLHRGIGPGQLDTMVEALRQAIATAK